MKQVTHPWQTVVLVTLMTVAVSFTIAALLTPQFRADSKILVIDKGISGMSDTRAFEVSQVLAVVVDSSMFITDVHNSPFEVKRLIAEDLQQAKEQVKKSIEVTTHPTTGIIELKVKQSTKKQAEDLSHAFIWTLISTQKKYHGMGEQIEMKLIDGPLILSKPVWPNIYLFCLIGLGVGLILSWIIVRWTDGQSEQHPKIPLNSDTRMIWKSHNFSQLKVAPSDRVLKEEVYSIPKRDQQPSASQDDQTRSASEHTPDRTHSKVLEKKQTQTPWIPVASETEEYVRKVEIPSMRLSQRPTLKEQTQVPDNLPIFESEVETPWYRPADQKEQLITAMPETQQSETTPTQKPIDKMSKKSVSDEEIKEKLNRLLKGEL